MLAVPKIKSQSFCLRELQPSGKEKRHPFFLPVLRLPKCLSEPLQSALGMKTMREGSQEYFSEKVDLESAQGFNKHQFGQSVACLRK